MCGRTVKDIRSIVTHIHHACSQWDVFGSVPTQSISRSSEFTCKHAHTFTHTAHACTHTHTQLYVIDVMSMVWCPHIVSQASQNFKPSKIQSTYAGCFAYFGVLHHQGSGVLHQLCLLQLQIMVRWAFSS